MKNLSRLHKIVVLVSFCLLAQLAISWKALLPFNREFPLISAFSFLQVHYGNFTDGFLFGFLIVCIASLIVRPFNKLIIFLLVIVFFFFILEDITRFQPWVYMYGLILLSVALVKDEQRALFFIRIILVGTYFWSGAQKFNHAFTVQIFPWLNRPIGLGSFLLNHHRIGYLVSFIEAFAGLGLLFRQTQKYAGVVLIIMHVLLLCLLGPFGNNWNKLIWPWNAALIGILVFIVTDKNYAGIMEIKPLINSKWFMAVFILTCLMPAFNFFGLWDNSLSGSLYSGNIPDAIFYFDKADKRNLPESAQLINDSNRIDMEIWAIHELNTPVYPEVRYFKRIGAYLSQRISQTPKAGLMIIEKQKVTSLPRVENFYAKDL